MIAASRCEASLFGASTTAAIKELSPLADLGYDFHDLHFERVK